ncbi:hypothetical protein JGK43_003430 [Edwardsiella piscicida]|nr:hypothetical protein [Edwardsiella piscicida]
MKVKSIGFSISNNNNNINTVDVMNAFIQASGREYHRPDYTRSILISDVNDFYYGLVVTFRNQKKDCKSQFIDGKFKLKIENLKGGDKLANFNFFLLKKSNLTGLYMYHHGSCSLNNLFLNLQTVCNEFVRGLRSKKINELGKNPKKSEIKEINEKYEERPSFQMMTNKNDMQAILNQFKEIKSTTFKFDYIDFKGGPMTALQPFVNTTTIDMKFNHDDKTKIQALSQNMMNAYNSMSDIVKARVTAVDHKGIEKVIDFMNCPTFFESYDFDIIAEQVDGMTNENYTTNPVFDIIKDEIQNGANKNVFI